MTNIELHDRLNEVEELLRSIREELEVVIYESGHYSSRTYHDQTVSKIKALELILNL